MTLGLNCIVPIRLAGGITSTGYEFGSHYEGGMARFNILLESMSLNLPSAEKLTVRVIVRRNEFDAVVANVARFKNIEIDIHDENKLVPGIGDYDAAGWVKQQVLKLAAVEYFGHTMSLILDDDIVCCQTIQLSTLVRNGRALTEWESRSLHPEWWRRSAQVLETTVNELAPGLSVTPEILSREIVLCLKKELQSIYKKDAWPLLLNLKGPWTEYTLYNICAEKYGIMGNWHLMPNEISQRLHSKCNFWSRPQYLNWNVAEWNAEHVRGIFMICQSNVLVETSTLRRQLQEVGILRKSHV